MAGLLLAAGCQKPAPVELEDTSESEISELTALPGNSYEPDTTGLLTQHRDRYFAELVVAGVRYDTPNETHTVSLARGIIRDRMDSIVINGRKIGYRTLSVGRLLVNGLPLNIHLLRYRIGMPGFPLDTVAGPYYLLLNKDGIGGRGFTYFGNYLYTWTNTGSDVVVNASITSAEEIRVTQPTPRDPVRVRRGLNVEWIGGEEYVYLVVSIWSPEGTRPVLQMRLRSASRQIFIPPRVLQMLPAGSSQYVFSFISQSRSEAAISGYRDTVLVYSASVHNLLLSVQR